MYAIVCLMTKTELYWLAGWLEGEGSFVVTSGLGGNGKRYPRIRLNGTSTDRDVLDHVVRIAGGRINGPYDSQHKNGKQYWIWTLSTHATALPLMRKLEPLMVAERRRLQVRKAIEAAEAYAAAPHGQKGHA